MDEVRTSLFAILIAFCACAAPSHHRAPGLHSILNDPNAKIEDVAAAAKRFPAGGDTPAFWSQIASDTRFSLAHRRACIVELFRRHVKRGTSLNSLAKTLAGASWLQPDHVHYFGALSGLVPLKVNLRDSIYSIGILPDEGPFTAAIYLRIEGDGKPLEFDPDRELFAILTGDFSRATNGLRKRRIREMAFSLPTDFIDPLL